MAGNDLKENLRPLLIGTCQVFRQQGRIKRAPHCGALQGCIGFAGQRSRKLPDPINFTDKLMTRSYRRGAKARMASAQNSVRRESDGNRWDREMSPKERFEYGEGIRAMRAAAGLTDGLRTDQKGFNDYLARRRAEDQKRRGW